jgi:integrase
MRQVSAGSCTNRSKVGSAADQAASVILGHSQLSQTQRYTHVTAELSRHAADRMSEALWG